MRQGFSCFLGFTECEKKYYTVDLVVSFFATDSSFRENSQKSPSLQTSAI